MQATRPGVLKSVTIAAATLAVAWHSYSLALIPNLRRSAPELVLSRNAADAVALSKTVLKRVRERGQYVSDPRDGKAARLSLVETPLSRSSLRIIGFDYASRRDLPKAAKLMSLSNRVSRRDTWAQVWLLEQAAREDDFDAILTHYHAALSVKPDLARVLNPILVSVTRFPEVRAALRPYLRVNASWTAGFLAEAATKAKTSDVTDTILPVAHHLADDAYIPAVSQIIYRLGAEGRSDEAMALADTVWDDFDREAFLAFPPDAANSDRRLGNLAWTFGSEGGISSQLSGEGVLEVTLSPLARGVVASRSYPTGGAGNYSLTQRLGITGDPAPSQMRWQAECVDGALPNRTVIWSQSLPLGRDAATYRSTISVPAGCSLVALSLIGTGPDGQREATVTLSGLAFERL